MDEWQWGLLLTLIDVPLAFTSIIIGHKYNKDWIKGMGGIFTVAGTIGIALIIEHLMPGFKR
jgi:hypothetical protein